MTAIIFQSLGGLGLFLFGMKIMSEGLQRVAGKKMRQVLGLVSNNRLIGCGVGTLVTSVIQSSSATTVMLVGFVDAGLITLRQAIGVILGANIGTTVTAQIIAFNISAYALPAVGIGVFLKFFVERRRWSYGGDVLLGFGLVFFGLATMKAGFAPLKEHAGFVDLFSRFDAGNYGDILLCILVGAGTTMILQSSSATVGVTMVFASQGFINLETSAALILGENIGTTITAQLASIGANVNARRTANAHSLFNVFGVFIIVLIFPYFLKLVIFFTSSLLGYGPPDLIVEGQNPNISRYIANSHTMFNVVNAMFFLAVLPYLVKVATKLTPQKPEKMAFDELHHVKFVDSKYVDIPSVALAQARAEIIRMGQAVQVMYDDVIQSIKDKKLKELSKWRKREDAIDILQREITQFLVRVIQENVVPEESKEVAELMRMTNNLESIGDAIENIAQLGEQLVEEKLEFSEAAWKDYDLISKEARRFIRFVVRAIRSDDKNIMPKSQEMEDRIDQQTDEMRENHFIRLQNGVCTVDRGLILVDMVTAFEKIGDFCYNIAQAVVGIK